MTMRLAPAILLACFVAIEAVSLPDPVIEYATVNGNRVTQKLRDLHNGTSSPHHRITLEYSPLNCEYERYQSYKFRGTLSSSGNWFDSEEICLSVCWQLQSQGWPCLSANYIQSKSTCELMQNKYGDEGTYDDLTWDETSTYLSPVRCIQPGQPEPEPTPTTVPTPTQPQPQPGAGGNTNNIQPGSCGQSSVPQRVSRSYLTRKNPFLRIVGGNEASEHSIPFIVSLRTPINEDWDWHFCGGALIRAGNKDESDIVATASHCIGNPNNPGFVVVAGAHYTDRKKEGEERVKAVKVVMHPEYNKPGHTKNDIAIVKLERPIKFSQTIQPACLPDHGHMLDEGVNGIVAGWGALEEGKGGPQALHQVVVPTISHAKCHDMYYGSVFEDASLCGGFEQGQKDSCQGDSGGPYFFEGKNGWTLHGVVSWGSGCARPRAPGVYARVSNYINWIQEQIKALSVVA